MTRRERMEARADKREVWAESAAAKASSRFVAADRAVEGIPFGQPILVGHHSEGRHRAALNRSDSNMRAGIERQDMAKRHEGVADTLRSRLETSIFSDDENAIAALEARIAEREAKCDRVTALNKALRAELKAGGGTYPAGAFKRVGLTEEEWTSLIGYVKYSYGTKPVFPGYVNSNMRGLIAADKKRIDAIRSESARQAQAEAAGGVLIREHVPGMYTVRFAEKPSRDIIVSLKAAGYFWSGGQWYGPATKLPEGILPDGPEVALVALTSPVSGGLE